MGLGYPQNQPNNSYWIIVFLLPIVPNIIRSVILTFIYTNDPPGYYVSKGKE